MKTQKFWAIKQLSKEKGELYLYSEIASSSWYGDEVTPKQFNDDLAALGDISELAVFINSPGGDVFAGITIYHILKRHPAAKTVHVDGIAASAASIVAMAGDRIVMPKAATMMIHNAWALVAGNKGDMRKMADELERVDGQLADLYAERTGKDRDQIAAWMDEERWMSGEEALADGFCDEVEENAQIAACADMDKFAGVYRHIKDHCHMPDNGEATPQPVADKDPEANDQGAPAADGPDPLAEQRKRVRALRLRLLEV